VSELFKKTFTPEFIRFLIVGVISAGIEYSLWFLFKMKMDYKIANVPAFVLTNIVTFILSNRYVFNNTAGRGNKRHELTLFILFLGGALLVNSAVLSLCVEILHLDASISKVIAIGVTVVWNFVTRKHIVFRNREVAPQSSRAPTDRANREF
jgi:putative flippase GtrA